MDEILRHFEEQTDPRSSVNSPHPLAGGNDRERGPGAWHPVGGRARDLGLSPGRVARGEESSEVTAIPARLRLVDIGGALIAIDPGGCDRGFLGWPRP